MSILLGDGRKSLAVAPSISLLAGRRLDLARQALHGARHRRNAGARQVEGHPRRPEARHPTDVRSDFLDRSLERGPATAFSRIGQIERVAGREPDRLAPPGPSRKVAQRRVALLERVEAEGERVPGIAQLGAPAYGR